MLDAWLSMLDSELHSAIVTTPLCEQPPEQNVAGMSWAIDPRCPKCRIRFAGVAAEPDAPDLAVLLVAGSKVVTWPHWCEFATWAMDTVQEVPFGHA